MNNITRSNWSLFTFQALIKADFALWINFNTKSQYFLFKHYLKKEIPMALCLKSQSFLKSNKGFSKTSFFRNNQTELKRLLSGGPYMVVCRTMGDLYKVIAYFLKDKYFKNNNLILPMTDTKYNEMYKITSGFMSDIKIYKYIFPFNKEFLAFLQTTALRLSSDKSYYNSMFFKITVVITFSLMLILIKMLFLLWNIFFALMRSVFKSFNYAYSKSINTSNT